MSHMLQCDFCNKREALGPSCKAETISIIVISYKGHQWTADLCNDCAAAYLGGTGEKMMPLVVFDKAMDSIKVLQETEKKLITELAETQKLLSAALASSRTHHEERDKALAELAAEREQKQEASSKYVDRCNRVRELEATLAAMTERAENLDTERRELLERMGTKEEAGFMNGDRKPAAQGDEDKLRAWSLGYEYYYDAYFGPDAPLGNQQPTAATLAEVLQAGARLVPLVIMAKDAEIASLREGEAHRLFEENKTLRNDLAAMTERASELEALFDTQTKAAERARGLYQAAHPEDGGAWPDRADLLVWLMERGDKAEQDCAMGKSLQDHFERGREAAIAEAARWKERAEKASGEVAEAKARAERCYQCELNAEKERDAARAEAEAAKQEAAGLRARKVKLPEIAYRAKMLVGAVPSDDGCWYRVDDVKEAVRAAGVDCE